MTDEIAKLREENLELKAQVSLYNAWFRAIDEHAKFDFWFKDANSNYRYTNPHFAKNMGWDKSHLEETPINEIFKGERFERIRSLDLKVMSDGYLNRVVPCDASGNLEMHEEHRFVVKGDDGAPIGLGCFAFEVTEKGLAEETLDQAEKLAKLCSWRWSAETNALISCSDQMAELLGVSLTEAFAVFPKRFEMLVLAEDQHIYKAIEDRRNGNSEGGYEIEYKMRKLDGSVIYVRETAEPFSVSNNGVEYLGVMQDVTEQKMAELALKRANENLESKVDSRTTELVAAKNAAEASDAAKTVFLANMSHELRTPLNAIIGFSDIMAQESLGPFANADYLELSQHILDNGSHLLQLIEDVFTLSDMKNDRDAASDFEDISLNAIIQSSVKEVEEACEKRNIGVIWVEPDQNYLMKGDVKKMSRVFQALLSNAVRFNKDDGFVKVALKPTAETSAQKGVFIDIADTGLGIAEDDVEKVMLPFVQVDNSLTRDYDGAGLGLTIAKRWVELHGGKISIASKFGKGTLVRLFLPAAAASESTITDDAGHSVVKLSA